MATARGFRYSHAAASTIGSYAANDPSIYEILEGFEWNVARDPRKGSQLGCAYWLYRTGNKSPIRPTITALHMFDDREISVVAVWIHAADTQ
jgi:hypothetical protein